MSRISRLFINILAYLDHRPAASFAIGGGLGISAGLAIQYSRREIPIASQFEETPRNHWEFPGRVVLPPVDTTFACPAVGYRIDPPACFKIDAPAKIVFQIPPVNTTTACPAATYEISYPSCYDIDAPPPTPSPPPFTLPISFSLPRPPSLSASLSLLSRAIDQFCGLAVRLADPEIVSAILAPALFVLADMATPHTSAARKHLVILEPMMCVHSMHHIWFIIIGFVLSLEPENVGKVLGMILENVFLVLGKGSAQVSEAPTPAPDCRAPISGVDQVVNHAEVSETPAAPEDRQARSVGPGKGKGASKGTVNGKGKAKEGPGPAPAVRKPVRAPEVCNRHAAPRQAKKAWS